jgi:RNA polymerase primary sigma factor
MDSKQVNGKEIHPPDDGLTFVDDPPGLYLDVVGKIPPLSRDEEISCIQHLRARDHEAESASKRLLEAHLRLVVSIAERYPTNGIHILDLIQHGNDGLLGAVQTFADSSEDNFPAYATPHIERAIAEGIASPGPHLPSSG